MFTPCPTERVEAFVREVVVPYERDPRNAGHLRQLETAAMRKRSALSPLGPVAVNTMAPEEGNTYLLGKVGTAEQKRRFLDKLVSGEANHG